MKFGTLFVGVISAIFGIGWVQIPSFTRHGVVHSCQLRMAICNCEDFKKRRLSFHSNDPRRYCKHLIRLLSQRDQIPDCLAKYPLTLNSCLSESRGWPKSLSRDFVSIDGSNFEIVYNENNWVNVYDGRKSWGFNPILDRWAYRDPPPHSRKLEMFIRGVKPLPPGEIHTIQRTHEEKTNWVVCAEVHGVGIQAKINTRAKWTPLSLDGEQYVVHIDELRVLDTGPGHSVGTLPGKWLHMEDALRYWFGEELVACRQKISI